MAQNEAQRQWYIKNRERLLVKAKKYREENKEAVARSKKICYERVKDTPEFKARVSAYHKSKQGQPERLARQAVARAVKRGALAKITDVNCQYCGEQADSYHHESYDKKDQLKVIPLCHKCHKSVHHTTNHS